MSFMRIAQEVFIAGMLAEARVTGSTDYSSHHQLKMHLQVLAAWTSFSRFMKARTKAEKIETLVFAGIGVLGLAAQHVSESYFGRD
jgi:hypothetical protein